MLTDLLIQHPTLFAVAAVVGLLACLVLGWLVVRRPVPGRRAARTVAVVAWIAILVLTLVPTSTPETAGCSFETHLGWLLTGRESQANIALFVPAALFATLAIGRRSWLVLPAGIGLSVAIEAIQGAVPALGRGCDANDVIANGLGTAVGVALALIVTFAARRRGRSAARTGPDGADAAG